MHNYPKPSNEVSEPFWSLRPHAPDAELSSGTEKMERALQFLVQGILVLKLLVTKFAVPETQNIQREYKSTIRFT